MVAVTEQKQILYSEKSMYKLCGLIKKKNYEDVKMRGWRFSGILDP